MKRYHCAPLAAVTDSMFLCRPSCMPVDVFQTPPYVFEFPDARCRPGFLWAGSPLYIHCNANLEFLPWPIEDTLSTFKIQFYRAINLICRAINDKLSRDKWETCQVPRDRLSRTLFPWTRQWLQQLRIQLILSISLRKRR